MKDTCTVKQREIAAVVSSPYHSRVDAPAHNQQLEEEKKSCEQCCCEIVESSVMVCSCHDFSFSGHCLLNDGDISGLAIANSAASRALPQ